MPHQSEVFPKTFPDEDEGGRRLTFVEHGSDAAAAARIGARIYVADDGGPIRTIMGDAHRHYTGEEHSAKTGLSNPYEGGTEHALKAKDDVERYVLGKPLEMFQFQEALAKPAKKKKMCTRRIFTNEVGKAKSAKGLGIAYNQAAARQRYGGGGVAQEPIRSACSGRARRGAPPSRTTSVETRARS